MFDVIVRHTNEAGELTPGWRRVRAHLMPNYVDQMIADGLDARRDMAATDPRRRKIDNWISDLDKKGYLPPGNYPMRGKAEIHVVAFTERNAVAAMRTSHLIEAQDRRARRYAKQPDPASATSTRTTPQNTLHARSDLWTRYNTGKITRAQLDAGLAAIAGGRSTALGGRGMSLVAAIAQAKKALAA